MKVSPESDLTPKCINCIVSNSFNISEYYKNNGKLPDQDQGMKLLQHEYMDDDKMVYIYLNSNSFALLCKDTDFTGTRFDMSQFTTVSAKSNVADRKRNYRGMSFTYSDSVFYPHEFYYE